MRPLLFIIIGTLFLGGGLFWTGYTWYQAGHAHKIDAAQAYMGPVLAVLGLFRIVSAASMVERNLPLRICAFGIGFLLAFGNHALLKAIYPDAQEISSSTH